MSISSSSPSTMYWVGMDVHKDSLTIAVFCDREPESLRVDRVANDDRLVLIHIPTEAEERARDLVRCRETFQRGIITSRHHILEFLRRRGFIYREGTHWISRHMNRNRQVLMPDRLAARKPTQLAATAVDHDPRGSVRRTRLLSESAVSWTTEAKHPLHSRRSSSTARSARTRVSGTSGSA